MLDADIEIGYSTYHPTDEVWVYNCLTEVWLVFLLSFSPVENILAWTASI